MEVKQNIVKNQLDIIYRPHPILPAADCQYRAQEWRQGQTIREILVANGIDQNQPISIILDDRLLTVSEWDTVCPSPCSIINVKAEVFGGGGGGGSNPVQIVALIAVIAVAIYAPYALGMTVELASGATVLTAGGQMLTAAIMIGGSLLVNSIFAAQMPSVDYANTSGTTDNTSPTYSISGGQNRQRQYESMPVLMGKHRLFLDLASKPFTENKGEDQYLYQIFNRGLAIANYSDYKIGTNSLSNYADWSWNYADQNGKISAFPGNVDSAAGAILEKSAGWIVRTTSTNTYKIGIDIDGILYYANDTGGLENTTVKLFIEYRQLGSSTWITPTDVEIFGIGFTDGYYETYTESIPSGYWTYDEYGETSTWIDTTTSVTKQRFISGAGGTVLIKGASQKPRRASLYITPATPGQYEVRIKRDTNDSTNSRLANKTNWTQLRSYQIDDGYYKGQDRIGLTIRASEQLNGAIQQLSAFGSAKANYWNGSDFSFGETSNPAHWFCDFAIGRKNSAGKLMYGIGLSQNQIDFDSIYAWSQFCTQEGLTFNAILDGEQTSADIISAIAKCGFASPTWASGKLGVVWDARNKTPVAAFGMSNIIKGSFTITYITENLAEEIIVKYINPNKDWNQDEVRVTVPGITNPLRTSTIDIFGCTSTSMAGKFANYLAAQQYYRRRRITWDCDFEGFVCNRGDVVLLSHDLTQWGFSGRVVSFNGNEIQLDRKVNQSGLTEYLMLKRPDGTMTTYSTVPAFESSDILNLSSTPDFQEGYEPMDHIWFFSPLATPGKKVKILSVQPTSDSRVQIVATDEDPEFYQAWDGAWIEPGNKTLLLDSSADIFNINVYENIYRGIDNSIKSNVAISWDARGSFDRFNVRFSVNNGPFESSITQTNNFSFDTNQTGKLDIEITPILGNITGKITKTNSWVYGVVRPLSNVSDFLSFYREGNTVLSWRQISDPRQIDYEIRKGEFWETAQVLGRVLINEFTTQGDGTYWVSAHTGTLYSPNPSSIVIEGSTLVKNVVATYDEEATGWSGTLTGGAAISGTNIILSGDPIPSEGAYEIPSSHIIDIGTSQECAVSCTYRMYADSPFATLFSDIPVFSEIASLSGNYAGKADVKIQIAIAPDSGTFGDWKDFVPGTYIGRKFKFKALLYSYDVTVTPVLDKFEFTVDMPDRIERGTNISCNAGGISVTYAKPFQISPNVQVTILNAVANDDIVITSQTSSGFNVKIINGASNVTRSINWIAQAY